MNIVLEGRPDSDQEELDALTLLLRERLLELDVDRVELASGRTVPEGAKPGAAIAVGALAVTLAPLALRGVLSLLETWLQNRPVRRASITLGDAQLDVEAVSSAEQRRLIDAFLAAHERPPSVAAGLDAQDAPAEGA
ncbi:hypothetical protein [Streptomyces sp. HD]|uniref:hypothetical protein n=1 Tax=Streptomyces sp. HD TaxID=3020892 RepID=UPI003FA770D8